ncbi:MAG: hypothetical protein RL213_1369 [Bacteroidota bacterium]
MFHRIGPAAYKADLSNTISLMEALGRPELGFRSVHVAGTNGKGSTSHMLAAVLQSAGYRTGLYTSPHLLDFRERIRIDGRMIPEQAVTAFVVKHREEFDRIAPSFFEWTVALAFDYFRNEKVDIAVIETGLGGRLDSTNVILPELSVITNIGLDHMNLLGGTLAEIATEKAGIIKPGIPVVMGERDLATSAVFDAAAEKSGAVLWYASDRFKVEPVTADADRQSVRVYDGSSLRFESLLCGLPAKYQQKNIATVLQSVALLSDAGWSIDDEAVRTGLSEVRMLTGLMGRWQKLSEKPLTVCDVGHNADGLREVTAQLKKMSYRRLHFVIGMVKDKDIGSVLELLPDNAAYYFCQPALPRALPVEELAAAAAECGLKGRSFQTVGEAVRSARMEADEKDVVFIGGSTFVVAEALAMFSQK